VGGLTAVYAVTNHLLPQLPLNGVIKTYVLQPVIWGILVCGVLRLPRQSPRARPRIRTSLCHVALLVGAFHVAVLVIGGLFTGFGKSPYSFTPTGITGNLVFAGSMLFGTELTRAWLVNHFGRKHAVAVIVGATVFFTVFNLSAGRLLGLGADIGSVRYLGNTVFPLLAANLLASYLAYLAGWRTAIAYRGVVEAFWWLSPVLPNLSWAFAALIGTALPVIGMVLANGLYAAEARGGVPRSRREEGSPCGWIATGIVAVITIWFAAGLFPVQPVLVASGSMTPELDVGDVALIAKIAPARIQRGDVIQFRTVGQGPVIHRVIGVDNSGSSARFLTQGDANDSPDLEPVLADNVVGKHIFTVRDIGWISVAVKELFVNRSG
jgi:signal peptidase